MLQGGSWPGRQSKRGQTGPNLTHSLGQDMHCKHCLLSCWQLQYNATLVCGNAQMNVTLQGAQGQADKVEERAEVRQQTGSPQQQSQASAVQQEMKQAAPKEDLEDTLSVLQGAESDLQEQQASQVLMSVKAMQLV